MTYDEFIKRLSKATCKPQKVSDADWETIQLVYTWHPAISNTEGKDEIVELYCAMGMPFIRSMAPQARLAMELDTEIRACRGQITERETALERLRLDAAARRDAEIKRCHSDYRDECEQLQLGFDENTVDLRGRLHRAEAQLAQLEGGETK